MKTSILIVVIALLFSCSSADQFPGNLLEREQSMLFLNYGAGEELYYDFVMRAGDKSVSSSGLKRVKRDFQNVKALDKMVDQSIRELERLKKEVISGTTDKNITGLQKNKPGDNRFGLVNYDLSQCTENAVRSDFSSGTENGRKIQQLMKRFRRSFCEKLVPTSNYGDRKYVFIDFGITDFKTEKELSEKVSALIKKNKVAIDDVEALKQIYASVSYSTRDWNELLPEESTSSEIIRLIVNLENTLLKVRRDAFGLMNSRISDCGYGFDKIMGIAVGKDVVSAGDTMEIAVTVAAFDSNREPLVKCTNGKIVGVKLDNGIRKIKLVAPGKSEQKITYRGTVTMLNKSGVPKTIPWEKTVWITE